MWLQARLIKPFADLPPPRSRTELALSLGQATGPFAAGNFSLHQSCEHLRPTENRSAHPHELLSGQCQTATRSLSSIATPSAFSFATSASRTYWLIDVILSSAAAVAARDSAAGTWAVIVVSSLGADALRIVVDPHCRQGGIIFNALFEKPRVDTFTRRRAYRYRPQAHRLHWVCPARTGKLHWIILARTSRRPRTPGKRGRRF